MRIDIISDTICPWCFIGKRRLERALALRPDLEPEIAWHPFQLNPDMPPEGLDRDLYLSLKFGGAARAADLYRLVGEAGAAEEIDFNFAAIKRTPNTLASHRLVHFAGRQGVQDAVVENLFQAYFLDGRDIGRMRVLVEIAAESELEAGAVRRYLDSDQDLHLVRAEDVRARQIGVTGVPCFIVDGRYAISGAQEPRVFLQVFAVAEQAATATAAI